MSFFNFFVNDKGLREFSDTPGAVLLDVRSPQEFREGNLPSSVNFPLQEIDRLAHRIEDKDTPIFLYCRSGARSSKAATILRHLGFTRVKNLGGIAP